MLALFAVIGLGYALGQISIGGFSLGVGAVLFAGLALGAIAPKAAPPGLVSSIGLVMFLYGIGIQYGRQFFAGLQRAGTEVEPARPRSACSARSPSPWRSARPPASPPPIRWGSSPAR